MSIDSSRTPSSSADPRGSTAGSASPDDDRAFQPVARTAADVLAIIPHTLAQWPRSSAVLLTATADSPGPCLRVDLPTAQLVEDPLRLLEWTVEIADLLEHDLSGDRVYVALFTAGSELAQTQLERVADTIAEASALAAHEVAGTWQVGATSWRPIDGTSADWASNDLIRTSPLWAAMVVAGSSVPETEGSSLGSGHPAPSVGAGSRSRLAEDLRVQDCVAVVRELADCGGGLELDSDQGLEGLLAWQRVLEAGEAADGSRAPAPGLPGDLAPEQIAGLIRTIATPGCSDALLAAVLTGDFPQAGTAWRQLAELSEPLRDTASLGWMAQVILGRLRCAPDWARVADFEAALEVLQDMLHAAPAARGSSAARGGAGMPSPVAEAEAALWVATAHVERFRARGSRAAQWLQLAEEAAPGHAGVLRAQQVAAQFPVPVWAQDPSTAWHR